MKMLITFVVLTIALFASGAVFFSDIALAGFSAVLMVLIYNLAASVTTANKINIPARKGFFLFIAGAGVIGQLLINDILFDYIKSQDYNEKALAHSVSVNEMQLVLREIADKILIKIADDKKAGRDNTGTGGVFYSLFRQNTPGRFGYSDSVFNASVLIKRPVAVFVESWSESHVKLVAVDPEKEGINPDYLNSNAERGKPEYTVLISDEEVEFRVRN